jgi:hypothetical protein
MFQLVSSFSAQGTDYLKNENMVLLLSRTFQVLVLRPLEMNRYIMRYKYIKERIQVQGDTHVSIPDILIRLYAQHSKW